MKPSSSQVDSDELAKFREQWKNEVRQKLQETTQAAPPTAETSTATSTAKEKGPEPETTGHKAKRPSNDLSKTLGRIHQRVDAVGPASPEADGRRAHPRSVAEISLTQKQTEAIGKSLYQEAITAEQRGDSEVALHLYQRSFRMNSNVDRLYSRSIMIEEAKAHARTASMPKSERAPHQRRPSVIAPTAKVALVPDTLAELLVSFSSQPLHFMPEDERQGVPLDKLPDELVVAILINLADRRDVLSIERFGSVCRKSRLISLDPVIWRRIVEWAYVPPQVDDLAMMRDIGSSYDDDWRHMYINHPRVSHLITYHRYLRFMPDGTVLSLLANNEISPSQVVHTLKPSLKTKGFYIGTWRLEDSTVIIEDLLDSERIFVRYGFEMTLDLKSKPHGRWNKLTFTTYSSVQLETGEREPLVLKHERPFWFSKVKSYTP
ncbi:hypothetical protein M407DRAFT_25818 [Tulasnella calospora MUT 4182]|uniref:Uncharacterized protein n=1 Tax=Tulasnella calospora MUT 4182 TaxID=1051891 RepID=A0A0C3QGX2_9AGAM|nr:hypothetical protein M407DRAFT_25818 [Tulasnella calospora MUT 4182]